MLSSCFIKGSFFISSHLHGPGGIRKCILILSQDIITRKKFPLFRFSLYSFRNHFHPILSTIILCDPVVSRIFLISPTHPHVQIQLVVVLPIIFSIIHSSAQLPSSRAQCYLPSCYAGCLLSAFNAAPLLFYAKHNVSEEKETSCCNSHMEAAEMVRNCSLLLQATSTTLGLACLFDSLTAGITVRKGGKWNNKEIGCQTFFFFFFKYLIP